MSLIPELEKEKQEHLCEFGLYSESRKPGQHREKKQTDKQDPIAWDSTCLSAVPTWRLHSYRLAFIVLENSMHGNGVREFNGVGAVTDNNQYQSTVNPMIYNKHWPGKICPLPTTVTEARLIKTQGQKLGFNPDLNFNLKWWACLPESQKETVSERCFLSFYNPLWAGIKGVHHHH